jgi:hypothetical protein
MAEEPKDQEQEDEASRARRLQAERNARRLARSDLYKHLMEARPDLTGEQIRQALKEQGEY